MKKERCEMANQFGICPYVTAQQLLSGKWAILILHVLNSGPKRFSQIQKEIDITQATLTTHLKNLEREGLLTRHVYPEVPLRVEYALTDIGREFEPVLKSIEVWGNRYIRYLREKNADGEKNADLS
jgi:DNA-binding HxlR family transcriptional regulator